jgi:hypothetical protein
MSLAPSNALIFSLLRHIDSLLTQNNSLLFLIGNFYITPCINKSYVIVRLGFLSLNDEIPCIFPVKQGKWDGDGFAEDYIHDHYIKGELLLP